MWSRNDEHANVDACKDKKKRPSLAPTQKEDEAQELEEKSSFEA